MSGHVCLPEPRSHRGKTAIGNATIARLHLLERFFQETRHGQQRRK